MHVAILGAGGMGRTVIGQLLERDDIEGIVAYDIQPHHVQEVREHPLIEKTTDLQRVLRDPKIRLAFVTASNAAHRDLTVQALEARGTRDPARDQIRITGRREGSVVVIELSDTGSGVPEKARAHMCQAFQGSARAGGTGLGLAIAAELVRAHGGEIRLVPGTIGATFSITIPDRAVDLDTRRGERVRA
jgi:signal transduction histidine kinase